MKSLLTSINLSYSPIYGEVNRDLLTFSKGRGSIRLENGPHHETSFISLRYDVRRREIHIFIEKNIYSIFRDSRGFKHLPRSIVTVFSFGPFSGRRNTYRLRLFSVYFRLRIRSVLLHVESFQFRTVF